jgi:hypothetical protein
MPFTSLGRAWPLTVDWEPKAKTRLFQIHRHAFHIMRWSLWGTGRTLNEYRAKGGGTVGK